MLLFTYTNLHNLPLLKINRSGYSSAVASSNLYHAIENTANLYAGKALCIRWYNTQHSHEALRAKNSHQILYGMEKIVIHWFLVSLVFSWHTHSPKGSYMSLTV